MARRKEDDLTYIRKDGVILRGNEADYALKQKDVEDILKESGIQKQPPADEKKKKRKGEQ